MPLDLVNAEPITWKPDCPASEPTPSLSIFSSKPSNFKIKQPIFEVPTSKTAITPRCNAVDRIALIALWE